MAYKWDGSWLVVSRSGVPATIVDNGEHVFCNQVHVDRLSPELCGGWIYYKIATTLLYPTERSRQYGVCFDDGTEISRKDAGRLVTILKGFQVGRDWEEGDVMVFDNRTTMHGKTVHKGQRQILATMGGSVLEKQKVV